MPIPNTPKPAYPNVPQAAGVPTVPRKQGSATLSNIVLLAADAGSVVAALLQPQWGLFTADGEPAFSVSLIPGLGSIATAIVSTVASGVIGTGLSTGEVEYRFDDRISTAPQEQGAFLSYNKVLNPFQGRVSYIVSGLPPQRGQFIATLQQYRSSLTLLSLVMPEYTFPSCNIVHGSIGPRSAAKGVSMFVAELWVEEVRITGTAAYSNTQMPGGANQVNGGTVQPQTPTPAQLPPQDGVS